MKKQILAVSAVLGIAALALGAGTLAYFTDQKSATNTFTVGNVKIELLESQLHRVNAGVNPANCNTKTTELCSTIAMEGSSSKSEYYTGGNIYTDEQIKEDAATYQSDYLANAKLAPGKWYHKMPYVLNTGDNDAYVRIRVMIPQSIDTTYLNSSTYTSSALNGEFTWTYDKTKEVGNVIYDVYEFTRVKPLAPEEMTYWNVWGTIHMDKTVTNKMIEEAIEKGWMDKDGKFNVLVEADAIQADGFDDATAAFKAFDAQN